MSTAVRETGVSRNHGGSHEIPRTSQHYNTEGFKRDPQYAEKRQSLGQLM